MQVVREQITRALAMKPSSIDQLKNKLRGLSYSEILRLRQSERMSQDDFQSPPIMSVSTFPTLFICVHSFPASHAMLCCRELRERIQPEILELIKQQRLNRLCEGSCFRKLGNRRRQGTERNPADICLCGQSVAFIDYCIFLKQKSSGSADYLLTTKFCTMGIWRSPLRVKCLLSYLVTRVRHTFVCLCYFLYFFKKTQNNSSTSGHRINFCNNYKCFFLFSPCLRYQVCVNRKRLPSYEGEKCSKTKQGAKMFIYIHF